MREFKVWISNVVLIIVWMYKIILFDFSFCIVFFCCEEICNLYKVSNERNVKFLKVKVCWFDIGYCYVDDYESDEIEFDVGEFYEMYFFYYIKEFFLVEFFWSIFYLL